MRTPPVYSPDLDNDLPEQSNIWGWMTLPLRRYARFEGRSGRREFWWYSLFLFLGYTVVPFAIMVPLSLAGADSFAGVFVAAYYLLFFFANFIPGLALSVRRLHDLGLPGALLIVAYLVMFILNVLGWIGYMVVMALPGQDRENQYGPPVGAQNMADVFS